MNDEKIEEIMTKVLEKFTKEIYKEFDKIYKEFDKIYNRLDALEKRFDEHEDKQRKDLALLEHTLSDKIDALFDAREVSLDEDENLNKKIKSMENILEIHNFKIAELESKIN